MNALGVFSGIAIAGAGLLLAARAKASPLGGGATADKRDLLVRGITLAEGGWDANLNGRPGTRPFDNMNPGDLMVPGDLGTDSYGYGVFSNADFSAASAGTADPSSDGFAALFHEVDLILSGQARVTPQGLDTTWATVAERYDTGGDALTAWLPNVASIAGMSPDQTVGEWLNA